MRVGWLIVCKIADVYDVYSRNVVLDKYIGYSFSLLYSDCPHLDYNHRCGWAGYSFRTAV